MMLPARPDSESPIEPVYEFNKPGESVTVYKGAMGGFPGGSRAGQVELTFGAKPGLAWSIEATDEDYRLSDESTVELDLLQHPGHGRVKAYCRQATEGCISDAQLGDTTAPLRRVLVHWINLPQRIGPIVLMEETPGRQRSWRGRWRMEVEGWALTLDQRADHSTILDVAADSRDSVLTHVMELRRVDGGYFTADEASDLIECLRVTLSFAHGRWVAPVLPVGFDADNKVAWERWSSPHCDPASTSGLGWMYEGSPDDLSELLRRAVPAFIGGSGSDIIRFQMIFATQAVGSGFVEQRILAAGPALENLSWTTLVLKGGMTKRDYQDHYAEDRLRYLLQRAAVPLDIDPSALPALAAYARKGGADGPTAFTRIRNALVHPQDMRNDLYDHEGNLPSEAWRLSLHYVTLLVLASIEYRGNYRPFLRLGGWAGETEPVPWMLPGAQLNGPVPLPPRKAVARRRP